MNNFTLSFHFFICLRFSFSSSSFVFFVSFVVLFEAHEERFIKSRP